MTEVFIWDSRKSVITLEPILILDYCGTVQCCTCFFNCEMWEMWAVNVRKYKDSSLSQRGRRNWIHKAISHFKNLLTFGKLTSLWASIVSIWLFLCLTYSHKVDITWLDFNHSVCTSKNITSPKNVKHLYSVIILYFSKPTFNLRECVCVCVCLSAFTQQLM